MATTSTVQFPSNRTSDVSMSKNQTSPELANDLQPSELLQYLPTYKVVICASCNYAIQPKAIVRHLKEIHHIHRGHRRPFMQYISKLDLDEAENVIDIEVREFPVPLLPVQDGLMCESNGCFHLCVSSKRMRTHWLSEHGRRGHAFLDWQPAPLQTFFRGNLLRYFTDPTARSSRTKNVPHCDLKTSVEYGKRKEDVEVHNIPLSSLANPKSYPFLNESDSLLFHHYITSTSLSISNDAETQTLWQTTVPRLAQTHPFLMHGILATSALHLVYLTPSHQSSHLLKATHHQSLALPLFRAATNEVTIQNSEAILIFSHLLIIYSFASESSDERLLVTSTSPPNNDPHLLSENENENSDILPPWLYFLRNGCFLLCEVWPYIQSSPVRPLARAWDIPITVPSTRTPLVTYLLSIHPPPSSPDTWDPEAHRLYTDAAYALGAAFASTQVLGDDFTTWDALRVWPMRISLAYMRLLRAWHPGALILLAHYCILLKKVEGHWYFEGRATRLLTTILKHLRKEWHCYIRWPLEEIGASFANVVE